MELRVLRYFLAVAREESITAAAKALHITQPTLSKQLMDLENELEKKLLIRGSRKITLTQDGMFLRKRAQEIIDLADKTESALRSADEIIAGDIYIGAGETEAVRLIANIVKELRTAYPGIRYHLFSGNGEDVAERLDKGLLDFGLFVGNMEMKKYDYLKLPAHDTWGLLLRKDNPLAKQAVIEPQDMLKLPILCSRQALMQNELAGWLGYSFDKLHVIATYNLIYNASLLVEAGIGAALCLDKLVNTSDNSKLCFRPFQPQITANLTIAWKKNPAFTKAATMFLKTLQHHYSSIAQEESETV